MGEWFELLNPGGQAINLHGWIVHDDGTNAFTVDEDIILPAGARVVLGTWDIWADNGGYVPDYVYSYSAVGGMQLGNGADEIVLQHGIIVVDRVDYMTSGWPDPVGASLVLRGTALTATGNDLGSNWCTATTPMPGGDEGTPGAPGGC
jgi:hypothetical protein